jgi:putative hydrolase of the HAD superfamily
VTILVLDLDGVVVRGHPQGGRWDKDIARDFGMSPEHLQTRFFQQHWREIEIGNADLFDVLARVWPQLECRGNPRTFVDYWFANDSLLDGDVLAEVDAWRAAGGTAYLATVQEHHRARYIWNDLKLSAHFDGMLYSAALGAKKPQAAFYERAHAKLPAASPADVLFLDDRQDNVDAANAFGWRGYLHRDVIDLRTALATCTPRHNL